MDNKNNYLITEEIQRTIKRLYLRINDRFPDSGLSNTCKTLHAISLETNEILQWISRPNYFIRGVAYFIIIMIVLATIVSLSNFDVSVNAIGFSDFIQMLGSALEGFAIAIAGIVFIVTFENRRKRERIIRAINKLRSISHIIDIHQLTKDPDIIRGVTAPTLNSPSRKLNKNELSRYLNYCSEMLALASKLGFLYIQRFPDPVATDTVNDLEDLATGLSRKIWQKIMIVNTMVSEQGGNQKG